MDLITLIQLVLVGGGLLVLLTTGRESGGLKFLLLIACVLAAFALEVAVA